MWCLTDSSSISNTHDDKFDSNVIDAATQNLMADEWEGIKFVGQKFAVLWTHNLMDKIIADSNSGPTQTVTGTLMAIQTTVVKRCTQSLTFYSPNCLPQFRQLDRMHGFSRQFCCYRSTEVSRAIVTSRSTRKYEISNTNLNYIAF